MKKIVFTGGGTAGHISPNLALISRLNGEFECAYMGTAGMEREMCAARGITFFTVPAVKLRRDAFFVNLSLPFRLGKCVAEAKKALKAYSPDLVFSKGGYAALPAVLAANRLGIPVISHESDMSPGLVTKIAAKRSARVLCSFADCAAVLKRGEHTGTPLSPELFSAVRDASVPEGRPVLLIMGGSSGAAAINGIAVRALPMLTKKYYIVHITGKNKGGAPAANNYRPIEFCDRMGALYKAADIAVTRAGAGALAELTAFRIPSVAIPLEKASRGDQLQNANYYAGRGALFVLKERDMTPEALVSAVDGVWAEREKFASAMAKLKVDGTDRICAIIRETVG